VAILSCHSRTTDIYTLSLHDALPISKPRVWSETEGRELAPCGCPAEAVGVRQDPDIIIEVAGRGEPGFSAEHDHRIRCRIIRCGRNKPRARRSAGGMELDPGGVAGLRVGQLDEPEKNDDRRETHCSDLAVAHRPPPQEVY